MTNSMRLLLILVVVLVSLSFITGRGIWKKKRPRDEDEMMGDLKFPAASLQQKKQPSDLSKADVFSMIDTYFDQLSEFVESPQFFDYVTPDMIQSIIEQIPMLVNSPEITQTLGLSQFKDPVMVKSTIKTGLEIIRKYLDSIKDIISDPVKLQEALDSVPEEYKPIAQQILNGDLSGLQNVLSSLPGMTPSSKALLELMISGDTNGVSNALKNVLDDSSQFEEARLKFLENPELAEAFGITVDVLQDKGKWETLMRKGLETLSGGSNVEMEDTTTTVDSKSKLFSKARAM